MKYVICFLVIIFVVNQHCYCQHQASAAFSGVDVKRKIAGMICDTCQVDFALNADPYFSYVITGSGHTPDRFLHLRRNFKSSNTEITSHSTLHFISQRHIGISFLPNFLKEDGKRTQLYRNFGGEDYNNLEFKAEQNGGTIIPWKAIATLKEDADYAILGTRESLDHNLLMVPWKQIFYAGNFNLNIRDTLNIAIRNALSKKIIHKITVIRAEDKADNFIYYQVVLAGTQFSPNLQHILNMDSGIPAVYSGDSLKIFEKDFAAIGLLRFIGIGRNEEIQYSFNKSPYNWHSARSNSSDDGVFIVLNNDMEAGKNQDIYLRYKSQPETIHAITIRVKEQPVQIPWEKIASISVLLLMAGSIGFYLWNKRNKRKLAALKRKNEAMETRLSLLSGQLNPHFLFNSLNAIQGTINSGNPEHANAYIGNVAEFMRNVMDNGRKEFVSLQEELKIEEDYLKLEQERTAFSYVVIITPEVAPPLIDFPPLLLQPVLENSLRHAFNAEFPNPVITIYIVKSNTNLCVEVSDNGDVAWDTVGMREGHGLSLTRKRIAAYNEKLESMNIDMQINYQPGKGTVTTFTFQNWLT